MMGSNGQTRVTYAGGTPTVTGTVTLFNSATAFPPGGCFHLLGLQWFQWEITFGTAADGGTGTVTGAISNDGGTTWRNFYTGTIIDGVTATPATSDDEVYVGMAKDIRFQYTNAGEVPTVFEVNVALNPHKPSSRTAPGSDLTDTAQAIT